VIDILEKIKKSEARDDKVIKAVEEIKKARVKTVKRQRIEREGQTDVEGRKGVCTKT